ncbi:hypothetical protein J7E70_07970 [Variovorax paradoxus]|nr:hypothetical protein [Variovorax paradoxus]MBT2300400.1 hypothetical protein [Variovorax paradoxus]
MGEVIEWRPRAVAKGDTNAVLAEMLEQDTAGELDGAICIARGSNGATKIDVLGSYSDRLQLGVLALVEGLGFVCKKIVASGTAGNTPGIGPVTLGIPNPRRQLPKRLREATNFGELE